jgi:hypothetical protein
MRAEDNGGIGADGKVAQQADELADLGAVILVASVNVG